MTSWLHCCDHRLEDFFSLYVPAVVASPNQGPLQEPSLSLFSSWKDPKPSPKAETLTQSAHPEPLTLNPKP